MLTVMDNPFLNEPAEVKLRRITKYFLEDSDYSIYTAYTRPNNEGGYTLYLVSHDFEYTTSLDDVVLTSNTADGIINVIETELAKLNFR